MKKLGLNQKQEAIALSLAVAIPVIAFLIAFIKIQAGPPRSITFAAGSPDGAYYRFAQEYAKRLEKKGLHLEVLETGGSLENLRLLKASKADIGFVQSGLAGKGSDKLRTLGTAFLEPLWLFYRGDTPPRTLLDLNGMRVAVGTTDSGTREVALSVLKTNRMLGKLDTRSVGGQQAKEQLLAGELDAAFFVGSPSVGAIRELALDPEVDLISFGRAQAYSRYHSSLSRVTLYAGMLDMAKDIPPQDVELVASAATLVVSEDFHYALATLMLQTAEDVHVRPGAFQDYGEFPTPKFVTFDLMPEAESFYENGPSFFFRRLPFYWAASLDRLIIFLVPALTLLLPLMRFLPPFYVWVLKRRLYQRQELLLEIELNEDDLPDNERRARLDRLEDGLRDLKQLPAAYQNEIFLLQLRMERVREELDLEQREAAPEETSQERLPP